MKIHVYCIICSILTCTLLALVLDRVSPIAFAFIYTSTYLINTPIKEISSKGTSLVLCIMPFVISRYACLSLDQYLESLGNATGFFGGITVVIALVALLDAAGLRGPSLKYRIGQTIEQIQEMRLLRIYAYLLMMIVLTVGLSVESVPTDLSVYCSVFILFGIELTKNRKGEKKRLLLFLLFSYGIVILSVYFGMPANRTTFVLPAGMVVSKFIVSSNNDKSIVAIVIRFTKRLKKRELLYIAASLIVLGTVFMAGLYGKVAVNAQGADAIEIAKLGIALQLNEFTDPVINMKLDAFLEGVSDSTRREIFLKNGMTVFTFIIPEVLRGGAEMNIMEVVAEKQPYLRNYLEPFFHQYLEGGVIGIFLYSVVLLQLLIAGSKKLFATIHGMNPCYILPVCIYAYFSYTYGFTRFMLPYFVAASVIVLAERLSGSHLRNVA